MLNHLALFSKDFRCIFSRRRSIRRPWLLLATHIRIKAKQKFFEVAGIKKTSERFLGLEAHFPDYGWFCHLWREIFILENYYFTASSDMPKIFDVGSNIGMSILFFKHVYPKASITGFEPDPQTFGWLEKTVKANKFQDVTLHNFAVSSEEGTLTFYRDKAVEASGVNSFNPNVVSDTELDTTKAIQVKTKKLSAFLTGPIDLLKMDIEGAEYAVFEEAKDHLASIQRIFLEVHQTKGKTNEPLAALFDLLAHRGFRFAITDTFITHSAFVDEPTQSYAIMVDAERV